MSEQKITVADLDKLVTEIFEEKEKAEILDEQLTEMNKAISRKEQKIIAVLKDLGLATFKGASGAVTPVERVAYKVPDGDGRDDFFGYLKEKEIFDGMITVNYMTLNSWAKKEYEAAKERGDIFFSIPGLGAPTISHSLHKTKKKA